LLFLLEGHKINSPYQNVVEDPRVRLESDVGLLRFLDFTGMSVFLGVEFLDFDT